MPITYALLFFSVLFLFGLKTYLQIWLPSSNHAPNNLHSCQVPDFGGQSWNTDPNYCQCLHFYYLFINLRTGLLLIWISTCFLVHIWRVNLAVPTDSVWKVIEGNIDIFWFVDMKLDRTTYTKHLIIVLFSIFYMCYMQPELHQFSNSVLVWRGQNENNGRYFYCRMCVDPPIVA